MKEEEHGFWYDGYFCIVQEDETVSIGRDDAGIFRQLTSYKSNILPVKNFRGEVVVPERVRDEGNTEYKVTKIRRSCYDGAKDLEVLHIPDCISSFEWCFWKCENLREIQIAKTNPNYCNDQGAVYSRDKKILFFLPPAYQAEEYHVLPSTREIEHKAFKMTKNLKRIYIPASVRKIGMEVFSRCSALKDVYIEGELNSFGGHQRGASYPNAIFHYQGKEWTSAELAKEVNKKIEHSRII